MKRFLALILSVIMICSGFCSVSAQEEEQKANSKISVLMDLGLIDKYEPNADVTRAMTVNTLKKLYGMDSYKRYLEERDMSQPILYGQMLMILVDITGYYPYIDLYKLDKDDPESYLNIAIKTGLTDRRIGEFTDTLKSEDYAELLYNAITEVDLLKFRYTKGNREYYVDTGSTLLNSVLDMEYKDGIVTGVNMTSLDSRESGRENSIAIDGVWYSFNTDTDPMYYLGMTARVFYNDDEEEIRSIVLREGKNTVVSLSADDIIADSVSALKLSYQKDGARQKIINIDPEADFVFNRCLLQAYTAADFRLADCTYRFIDNNLDSKADVIIADQYGTFMVNSVITDDSKVIDVNSTVYEFEKYLLNGFSIYNADGSRVELDDLGQYNIVSYQVSRNNEYTNFIVSSKNETGILGSVRDGRKYVTVSGTEYECLAEYYNHTEKFEKVNAGDEVKLFFDFKGKVADIKRVSSSLKAGYALRGYLTGNESFEFKLLTEDGEIKVQKTSPKVTLNGKKVSEAKLAENSSLFNANSFIPQLILYKESADGTIFRVDTAEDKSGIGHTSSNSAFTLDYDWEKESTLRILTFNGKKVLGSKYLPDSDTKIFGISTELNESYVQPGTSLGTGTSYKIKLYNVNDDYVPEYAVLDISPKLGDWVDWTNNTYVVDSISMVYDEEDDNAYYQLSCYDGKGNLKSSRIRDGELKTPNGNSLSGDNRLRQVAAKNLPKGTVLQFKEDKHGISSISVQAMPMADNTEKLFEKANSSTSYDYGISEYMFNGASICSYGEVISRVPGGIVVNNHIPTDVEAAKGGVFPMESWNRIYPFTASDSVWFYIKETDELKYASASEILEGDMIFMHRKSGTINTAIVYR